MTEFTTDTRILRWAIEMIRRPAGSRFNDFEEIKAAPWEFFENYHRGLRELHECSIDQIIAADKLRKIGKSSMAKHFQTFWRKINDCIVWQMLREERHRIRRLCFHREKGFLVDKNPDSIRPILRKLNEDPRTLAIWTDATTLVDVGDILRLNMNVGKIELIEIKEGKVNSRILGMSSVEDLFDFVTDYGEKGVKQIQRMARQHDRSRKVKRVIVKEGGFDPATGKDLAVTESRVQDQYYDKELDETITNAKAVGEGIHCVDGVVWLYVTTRSRGRVEDARRFAKLLSNRGIRVEEEWLERPVCGMSLRDSFHIRLARPVFMRNLFDGDIQEIFTGRLAAYHYPVFDRLLEMTRENGGDVRWSTLKQGRRLSSIPLQQRPFTWEGRYIETKSGDFSVIVGDGMIIRMIFDGIKPSVITRQLAEMPEEARKVGKISDT